jgi:hypothetical protein
METYFSVPGYQSAVILVFLVITSALGDQSILTPD